MKADISGEILHVIKSVSNVLGFLGETKGGEPIPLRQSEVNRMLGKVDELAISGEQINIPFTIGESVKVIDGPFNGFTGSIDNVNEEDQLRADMYSFLANLLRAEPDENLVNQLTMLDSDDSPIGKSIKTLSKLATSLDLPTIRDEYVRIFVGVGRGEILPFASYYLTGFLKVLPPVFTLVGCAFSFFSFISNILF